MTFSGNWRWLPIDYTVSCRMSYSSFHPAAHPIKRSVHNTELYMSACSNEMPCATGQAAGPPPRLVISNWWVVRVTSRRYSIESRGSSGTPKESGFSPGLLYAEVRLGLSRRVSEVLESYKPLSKSKKHCKPTANVVSSRSMETIVNTVNVARVVSYCASEPGS